MRPLKFLIIEGNVAEVRERMTREIGHDLGVDYAQVLRAIRADAEISICYPAELNSHLPTREELARYDGVVIGGSSLNIPAYKEFPPEVARQIELTREAFRAGARIFGSCWGLQVLAVAAGGTVRTCPSGRELGLARNITTTDEGREHPLYRDKPHAFDAVAVHMDEVETLPPDSTLLACNTHSHVQALEVRYEGGIGWGVQYHPEFSLRMMGAILRRYGDTLVEAGFFLSIEELLAHAEDITLAEADSERIDLAWRYGLTAQVLDATNRTREIRNWIDDLVQPAA